MFTNVHDVHLPKHKYMGGCSHAKSVFTNVKYVHKYEICSHAKKCSQLRNLFTCQEDVHKCKVCSHAKKMFTNVKYVHMPRRCSPNLRKRKKRGELGRVWVRDYERVRPPHLKIAGTGPDHMVNVALRVQLDTGIIPTVL